MEDETFEPVFDHGHGVTLQELQDIANTDKRIAIRCGEKYEPISEGHKVKFYGESIPSSFTIVEVDEPRKYYPTTVELLSGEDVALRGVLKRLLTVEGGRDWESEYGTRLEDNYSTQKQIEKNVNPLYRKRALELEWPGAKHTNTLYSSLRKSYADKLMEGSPLRVLGFKEVVEISPDLSALL